MDWKKLFKMQKQLDDYIEENHGVQKEELMEKKILALLVEVGELANETRCFKFWSHKNPSEKEIILEEYVDGTHFLLSLGLEKGYEFSTIDTEPGQRDLTGQFNQVFSDIVLFNQSQSESAYKKMFAHYVALGSMLGFSAEDIHKAYLNKNEVNHQRQNNGY